MDNFVINGGHELFGEVDISGAKNAAVAIIPAALLAEDTVRIENIPQISDVQLIIEILSRMGAQIKVVNKNTLDIDTTNINYQSVPYELTSHFRASYYLIGAMLGSVFIRENDYIICEAGNEKHVCGADRFPERFKPVE